MPEIRPDLFLRALVVSDGAGVETTEIQFPVTIERQRTRHNFVPTVPTIHPVLLKREEERNSRPIVFLRSKKGAL
jgi:hypothetical protein